MNFLIRASSYTQLWCLQRPNVLTKMLLSLLYSIELMLFIRQGARNFLTRRSAVLGSNYAALGRLIVGEYYAVANLVKNPQQRGAFLGPARLLRNRLPSDFLLFLADKDAAGMGLHKTFHDYIWNSLLIQAQDRSPEAQLQILIDELVHSAQQHGNIPDAKAITPDVQRMVIRYMMLVILEVTVNETQVEAIRKLFYTGGPTANYILATITPFALPDFMLRSLQHNIDEIVLLIQSSPVLKDYVSSIENHNLSKQQWSYLLLSIIGIAALSGGSDLATYVLSEIPSDFPIDTLDSILVQRAILETARRYTPVNIVNVITPQLMAFEVAGKACYFPRGTVLAASIGLANLDNRQFPDSAAFKPDRDNLMSAIINFNSVGFHATDDTRRCTCPGCQIVLSMCSDLLVAWLNAVK